MECDEAKENWINKYHRNIPNAKYKNDTQMEV